VPRGPRTVDVSSPSVAQDGCECNIGSFQHVGEAWLIRGEVYQGGALLARMSMVLPLLFDPACIQGCRLSDYRREDWPRPSNDFAFLHLERNHLRCAFSCPYKIPNYIRLMFQNAFQLDS